MKRHSEHVAALTKVFCGCLGVDRRNTTEYVLAAYLHGVGKLAIPSLLLSKWETLTYDEILCIRRHTEIGSAVLLRLGYDLPAVVALCHHEAWDGKGYPCGLRGNAIPFVARLIAICDVYSALRMDRPYRRGLSHEGAMMLMLEGDGTDRSRPSMFDPHLLSIFAKHNMAFAEADRSPCCPDFLQAVEATFGWNGTESSMPECSRQRASFLTVI